MAPKGAFFILHISYFSSMTNRQKATIFFILALTGFGLRVMGQQKPKPIDQLTADTSGWTIVEGWTKSAKNQVTVLKVNSENGKDALVKTQVTTRSPMGAIIYFTGGLLIDNGWIRILGSGNEKLKRSLPGWNKGKSFIDYGEQPKFLLIADDAAGGFFAINGGALGSDLGKVYYLAPDTLEWEDLGRGYSDFLNFCLNGDLDQFYANLRWKGWKTDVANLQGDQVYNFYPFLWTKEGKKIDNNSRKSVPVEEQYHFNIDMRKQLHIN